jgi:hypothetical protein
MSQEEKALDAWTNYRLYQKDLNTPKLFAIWNDKNNLFGDDIPWPHPKDKDTFRVVEVKDGKDSGGNKVQRVLRIGNHKGTIHTRWLGKLTGYSKQPTFNEELIASGPIDWIKEQWKDDYGRSPSPFIT